MTSWCTFWKPPVNAVKWKTESHKCQTRSWIPLQTCSGFFTVGLGQLSKHSCKLQLPGTVIV